VHALLGENGAGKSTLMNNPLRALPPDEGEILIKGKPVLGSPSARSTRAVGWCTSTSCLIPVMTVAENIVLAQEPRPAASLDIDAASACASSPIATLGSTPTRIEEITVGQQQRSRS
jgi:simple sugar transport system ATP-binding protein